MLHSRTSVLGLGTVADVADVETPKTQLVGLVAKPQTWAFCLSVYFVWFLTQQVARTEASIEQKLDRHIAASEASEKFHDQSMWQICVGVNPKNPSACPAPPRVER